MRDLTAKRFNSNSPQSNYVKLREQIELLQSRFRELDQRLLEGMVRVSELEDKSGA